MIKQGREPLLSTPEIHWRGLQNVIIHYVHIIKQKRLCVAEQRGGGFKVIP